MRRGGRAHAVVTRTPAVLRRDRMLLVEWRSDRGARTLRRGGRRDVNGRDGIRDDGGRARPQRTAEDECVGRGRRRGTWGRGRP